MVRCSAVLMCPLKGWYSDKIVHYNVLLAENIDIIIARQGKLRQCENLNQK